MDANGLPTINDVLTKMLYIAPDELPPGTRLEANNILKGVIAEFQSPPGLHGIGGGTGRRFEPVQATRYYDGNGYSELRIDDIVSTEALQVSCYGSVFPDVIVQESDFGRGYNLLIRPQSVGVVPGVSYGLSAIFPTGRHNITVTATFGYSAKVPDDVFNAILAEVGYRMLVEGFIGIDGSGDKLQIGTFSVESVGDVSNWLTSSTPGILHTTYTNAISAYRDRGQRQWKRLASSQRIS